MKMQKRIKLRVGAKFISDVEIPDTSWKPDFEIVDRYQSFASELMKIGLLGIGGYSLLIKYVVQDTTLRTMFKGTINYLEIGSISLGLSLSLLLVHRFLSTDCLYYQVLIMRSLKRLSNDHWNETEKKDERNIIEEARSIQREKAKMSKWVLIFSAIFFAIGFIFVLIVFNKFLLDVCSARPPHSA